MKKITLSLFILCIYNYCNSQIVAWNTDLNTGDEVSIDATTLDPNLNTSTLVRGSGINPSALARSFSSTAFTVNGNQANAISNDEYLEFQISSTSGFSVSLSTLDANFRRSNRGPDQFIWRYSTDGTNFTDIGSIITYTTVGGGGTPQTQIDLSTITALQNVPFGTTITFRLYAWNATFPTGTFAIGRILGTNNLSIGGTVSKCSGGVTTWNGSSWDNGSPDLTTEAIIANNYNTGLSGDLSTCNLTINSGATLTVSNASFVEVENDVVVNGTLSVQSQGNFVQNANDGTFTNNGSCTVNKNSALKNNWFYYTYWSSPVQNETIGNVFSDVDADRRFFFNANNYLDANDDDVDDDGNDWQFALSSDTMTSGVGYAATSSRLGLYPSTTSVTFTGTFNTGDISTPIVFNAGNAGESWNFIGNPYPSAIDFDAFFAANAATIEGAAYLWSQATPPSSSNAGNRQSNFSQNDYAVYASGMGTGTAGASGTAPSQFIPSGQGFFVSGIDNANVTFTNAMRSASASSNSQFFKQKSTKVAKNSDNKLWLNLTTNTGVFSQILVGYVDGASKADNGMSFDVPRVINRNFNAILYSLADTENTKYVIQGRAREDITTNEIINIGYSSTINSNSLTTFKISIAQFEGRFFDNSAVIIRDNELGITHNLSEQDYIFTSATGEFNERFQIEFSENTLSANSISSTSGVSFTQQTKNSLQIKTSASAITTVKIYDLLGKQVYVASNKTPLKTLNIPTATQSTAVHIIEVTLNNGNTITKKLVL